MRSSNLNSVQRSKPTSFDARSFIQPVLLGAIEHISGRTEYFNSAKLEIRHTKMFGFDPQMQESSLSDFRRLPDFSNELRLSKFLCYPTTHSSSFHETLCGYSIGLKSRFCGNLEASSIQKHLAHSTSVFQIAEDLVVTGLL